MALTPLKQSPKFLRQIGVEPAERVLAAKAADTLTGTRPQADTSQLEREIDQLVYQLYGLTEEEIAIVEEQA